MDNFNQPIQPIKDNDGDKLKNLLLFVIFPLSVVFLTYLYLSSSVGNVSNIPIVQENTETPIENSQDILTQQERDGIMNYIKSSSTLPPAISTEAKRTALLKSLTSTKKLSQADRELNDKILEIIKAKVN